MTNQVLSTTEMQAVFAEEISHAGGVVSDSFDDGVRLFARSVLPWVADVRPKDQMQGGVALRAAEGELSIHPYLFREVCKNGAIRAHATETRRLEITGIIESEDAVAAVREAVRACCVQDVFAEGIREIHRAIESDIDIGLNLAPLLSRINSVAGTEMFKEMVFRFAASGDRSRFALMNAVTSVAREVRDPELRWRLEELGGGIAVSRISTPPSHPAAASLLEWDENLEVGQAIGSEALFADRSC